MPKAPRNFPESTRATARVRLAWPLVLVLVLALAGLLSALAGCRSSQSTVGLPEASLSASSDAQTTFRRLRAARFAGSTQERRKLEPDLRRFLVRFPGEESSDMVRVLLAFDCASRGSLQEARVLLAQVRV